MKVPNASFLPHRLLCACAPQIKTFLLSLGPPSRPPPVYFEMQGTGGTYFLILDLPLVFSSTLYGIVFNFSGRLYIKISSAIVYEKFNKGPERVKMPAYYEIFYCLEARK